MITRKELLTDETYWIETIQNKIYNDLIECIENNKISQTELAKKLNVTKGYISQILKGENLNFRLETLVRISLAIGKIPNFTLEDTEVYLQKDQEEQLSYSAQLLYEIYIPVNKSVVVQLNSANSDKKRERNVPFLENEDLPGLCCEQNQYN